MQELNDTPSEDRQRNTNTYTTTRKKGQMTRREMLKRNSANAPLSINNITTFKAPAAPVNKLKKTGNWNKPFNIKTLPKLLTMVDLIPRIPEIFSSLSMCKDVPMPTIKCDDNNKGKERSAKNTKKPRRKRRPKEVKTKQDAPLKVEEEEVVSVMDLSDPNNLMDNSVVLMPQDGEEEDGWIQYSELPILLESRSRTLSMRNDVTKHIHTNGNVSNKKRKTSEDRVEEKVDDFLRTILVTKSSYSMIPPDWLESAAEIGVNNAIIKLKNQSLYKLLKELVSSQR